MSISKAEELLHSIFIEIDDYFHRKQEPNKAYDNYEKRTIAELKGTLRELGLPISGRKYELVNRLRDFVSKDIPGKSLSGRKKE
jgi:hypothetical protein